MVVVQPVFEFVEYSSSLPTVEHYVDEEAFEADEPQLDIFTDTTIPEKKGEENMMI